jgi:hypothetical protein
MVGPSTPMIEELLDFSINVLAGLKVINPYSLMKKISQGMVNEERLKGDALFVIMTKKGDNIIISTPRPFVSTLSFHSFYVHS